MEFKVTEVKSEVETIKLSNEPLEVKMFQCPHCQTRYKTKETILKHINKCNRNPKFFSGAFERGVDSKGNVFEKRKKTKFYEKEQIDGTIKYEKWELVVLFKNGRFAESLTINGEKPHFIKYPRKIDFEFEKVECEVEGFSGLFN